MVVLAARASQIEDIYNNAIQNPYTPDTSPNFGAGIPSAIGTGFERGELEIANFLAPDESDSSEIIRDAMEMAKPSPQTTGWLGEQLYGLSSAIPAVTVGAAAGGAAGAAALLGVTKGYAKTGELEGAGVDENTAAILGTVEGVTQGAGALLPAAIPGKLATRILSGSALNIGIGGINRGTTGAILDSAGYPEMAKQYRVIDGSAIFVDAVLGGAFGALHNPARTHLPSEVDAALVANNMHQLEIDSAPGIPTDNITRNSHVEAMTRSANQLLRGDDVNVLNDVRDTSFIPKEENTTMRDAFNEVLEKEGIYTKEMAERTDLRYEKYSEVVVKHEAATAELEALNTQLQKLEEGITESGRPTAIFAGVDEDIIRRISAIDEELSASDLAKKQRTKLESEQKKFRDEYNRIVDSSDVEKNQSTLDSLEQERETLTKKIDQKERQIDRYANEMDRRAKKLTGEKSLKANSLRHLEEIHEVAHTEVKEKEIKKEISTAEGAEGKTIDENGKEVSAEDDVSKNNQDYASNIITEKPDILIAEDDGRMVKASEAIAFADEGIKTAKDFSKLFEVAVNCAIRNGSE